MRVLDCDDAKIQEWATEEVEAMKAKEQGFRFYSSAVALMSLCSNYSKVNKKSYVIFDSFYIYISISFKLDTAVR